MGLALAERVPDRRRGVRESARAPMRFEGAADAFRGRTEDEDRIGRPQAYAQGRTRGHRAAPFRFSTALLWADSHRHIADRQLCAQLTEIA